jgi:octaprenyl-diphosphate synthase
MLAAHAKPTDIAVTEVSAFDSRFAWKEIVGPVEPFLEKVAQGLGEQVRSFESEIVAYAQYALTNQGKQLRPALVVLSGKACGGTSSSLVKVAIVIEMVHLATLVHDDVMDEADIRRSRPTLAANWGNKVAVLLGDCLLAHAVQLAASFPTTDVCRAVSAATNRVCTGEILQTQNRGNLNLTRAQYFKILEMKTAALFSLSCEMGATLSEASQDHCGHLRDYGLALGTAYQIYDDCLDLYGAEAFAGKSLGTDMANGKYTLPIISTLERASEADQAIMAEWLANWDRSRLVPLLTLLERYDALNESRRVIQSHLQVACQHLAALPFSKSRAALVSLTEFLAQQTDELGVVV